MGAQFKQPSTLMHRNTMTHTFACTSNAITINAAYHWCASLPKALRASVQAGVGVHYHLIATWTAGALVLA